MLIFFFPIFPFDPPKNRKPRVFQNQGFSAVFRDIKRELWEEND